MWMHYDKKNIFLSNVEQVQLSGYVIFSDICHSVDYIIINK